MKTWLAKLFKDDSGISAVEYSLLLSLIGAGIAAAAFGFGEQVNENMSNARAEIAGPV